MDLAWSELVAVRDRDGSQARMSGCQGSRESFSGENDSHPARMILTLVARMILWRE